MVTGKTQDFYLDKRANQGVTSKEVHGRFGIWLRGRRIDKEPTLQMGRFPDARQWRTPYDSVLWHIVSFVSGISVHPSVMLMVLQGIAADSLQRPLELAVHAGKLAVHAGKSHKAIDSTTQL